MSVSFGISHRRKATSRILSPAGEPTAAVAVMKLCGELRTIGKPKLAFFSGSYGEIFFESIFGNPQKGPYSENVC
jgi:hypothetical protein